MGSRLTRVLAVLGAVAILVVGVNAVAYAATGKSLILGKTNKASKVTTVQRTTTGPALNLKTKASTSAPFTTNAKGKVVNLNADKVDGVDGTALNSKASSALAKANAANTAANDIKAIRFQDTSNRADDTIYNIGAIPKGTYLVNFSASVRLVTAGTPASPNVMDCALYNNNSFLDTTARSTTLGVANTQIAPSFSTVLTVTGTESWRLSCATDTGDGWQASYSSGTPPFVFFVSGEGPTLSWTKLDGVTNKTLPVVP